MMKCSNSLFFLAIFLLQRSSFGELFLSRQHSRIPLQCISNPFVGRHCPRSKYHQSLQKQGQSWVQNVLQLCYRKGAKLLSPKRSASTSKIGQDFFQACRVKIKQPLKPFQQMMTKPFKWFRFHEISQETIELFAFILKYSFLGLVCVEIIHIVFDLSQEILSDGKDDIRRDSEKALSKKSVEKLIAWLERRDNKRSTWPSIMYPACMISLAHELYICNELTPAEVQSILLQLTNAEVKLLQACLLSSDKKIDFAAIGGLFDAKDSIGHSLMSYLSGLSSKRKSTRNNPSPYLEIISRGNGHHNMVLWGPPGCGKSLLIRAIAKHSGLPTLVPSLNLMRDHYTLGTLLSLISKLGSCVVVLDDLDGLVGNEDRGIAKERKSELMQWWDDVYSFPTRYSSKNVFIVGATSHPWNVDIAIYRRLPNRIYIGLPNSEDRYDLLKSFSKTLPPIEESVLQYFVSHTEGCIPTDIYQILVHACQNGPMTRQDTILTINDVNLALSAVQPTRFPIQYIQQLENFIMLNVPGSKSSITQIQTRQSAFLPNAQEYLSPHVIQSFPFSESGYCWETTVGSFYQFQIPVDSDVVAAIQTILLNSFEWNISDGWNSSEGEDEDH